MGQKKYRNYTRKGLSCDNYEVSVFQFEKLDKERIRLQSEIRKSRTVEREARARWERLKRLKEVLEAREEELIRRKVDNMEELDR